MACIGIDGVEGVGIGVQMQMPMAKVQMSDPIMAAGDVKAQWESGVLQVIQLNQNFPL
jgi:hypothetical protein